MSLVQINSALNTDGYKLFHAEQYNPETKTIQINCTARKSRIKRIDKILHVGSSLVWQNLVDMWEENFFSRDEDEVLSEISAYLLIYTGSNYDLKRFKALHKLGFLPLSVRSLPEGVLVPIGVPYITVENTLEEFFWLPNFLETTLSAYSWPIITSATIALEYDKILREAIKKSGGNSDMIKFQAHDFSMRGMMGLEGAILSGVGHAAVFDGTDTVPVVPTLAKFYNATTFPMGVPATEHSVMCTNTGFYIKSKGLGWNKYGEAEKQVFIDLLEKYPIGIISIVSDTWDLWKVITEYLADPEIKKIILEREGTVVIRPDSGDPADIVCGSQVVGDLEYHNWKNYDGKSFKTEEEFKGVFELLWDIFGGSVNELGFKQLDPHINVIYGDSITRERCQDMCNRLIAKRFVPSMVFGIGSFTYQYNTRDTFGFAWKATWAKVGDYELEIFKDPVTDDGTKKSAKGYITVFKDADGEYVLIDGVKDALKTCETKQLMLNGEFFDLPNWDEVKSKVNELRS